MKKKALLIFARNPNSDNIKTRLSSDFGKKKALEIYISLLDITFNNLKNIPFSVIIYWTDSIPVIHNIIAKKFIHKIQSPGNLGEKIFSALRDEFNSYDSICIIGSDCPELTEKGIKNAFLILESKDIVIGPSLDGGYYLLGMNGLYSRLFEDISWGTSSVMSDTIQRVKDLKLRYLTLEILRDVDIAEDYLYLKSKNILK